MKLETLKKRLKGFGKIKNMDTPNQFIIEFDNGKIFQSYNTIIAVVLNQQIYLTKSWDYSKTTGKYRNIFLNENKTETIQKIKNGEYKLID